MRLFVKDEVPSFGMIHHLFYQNRKKSMADYKLSKYSAMTAKEFSSSPTKMDILAKDKKITAFIQIIEQPFAAKSSRKKRRCD